MNTIETPNYCGHSIYGSDDQPEAEYHDVDFKWNQMHFTASVSVETDEIEKIYCHDTAGEFGYNVYSLECDETLRDAVYRATNRDINGSEIFQFKRG